MAFLLRVLTNNVRWDKTQFPSWLDDGKLPADLLKDLKTDENNLSLWEIDDNKANLDIIITAIASTRKNIGNVDYALIKKDFIDETKFKQLSTTGDTPYTIANKYHIDLSSLSMENIVHLSHLFFKNAEFPRKTHKAIKSLLQLANRKSELDRAKIPPELLEKIGI